MADAFRMPHDVGGRDRPALRDAEQRETFEATGINHGLQVPDPRLEGEVLSVPIGKAAAALIISHEQATSRQCLQPMTPHRALPIEFEMAQPVGRFDQWRPTADGGVGDANAISRSTEADLLAYDVRSLLAHVPRRDPVLTGLMSIWVQKCEAALVVSSLGPRGQT